MSNELTPINNELLSSEYLKSEELIMASYDFGKFAQTVLATALVMVKNKNYYLDDINAIGVDITVGIMEKVLGKKFATSIYNHLEEETVALHKKVFRFYRGDSGWVQFNLIKTSSYDNGVLKIIFHEGMTNSFLNPEGGTFRILDATVVDEFTSKYAIRFYEYCINYEFQARTHGGKITKNFHYIELKDKLGCINRDNEDVNALWKKYGTDYSTIEKELDKMIEDDLINLERLNNEISILKKNNDIKESFTLSDKLDARAKRLSNINEILVYPLRKKFNQEVMKKSKDEIMEKFNSGLIDVCFDYSTHGKNYKLTFYTREGYKKHLQENRQLTLFDDNYEGDAILTEDEKPTILITEIKSKPYDLNLLSTEELLCFTSACKNMEMYFDKEEVFKICDEAGFDIEKIDRCYKIMLESSKNIENSYGFMVAGVKGDGYKPGKKIKKDIAPKNRFNNIPQHDYDFEELEQKLIRN